MNVDEALAIVDKSWDMSEEADAAHVLAGEVKRLREVLAGQAPAKGSWQTEALALRAELDRLRGPGATGAQTLTEEWSHLGGTDVEVRLAAPGVIRYRQRWSS